MSDFASGSEPTSNNTTAFRQFLALLGDGHSGGSRTSMTCIFRCGNACAHPEPNFSDNDYFGDIAQPVMSRRGLLQTVGLGALVLGTARTLGAEPAAAKPHGKPHTTPAAGKTLSFTPVAPNRRDLLVVPDGYSKDVVIRWGDPVLRGAPAFDPDNQTARSQAAQFGYNNDFVWFMPLEGKDNRALLVVNHEYTNELLMFRDYVDGASATRQHVRVAQMAHGLSVVEIKRERDGDWKPVRRGRVNRRITTDTPMRLTGPAAGSRWLRTEDDPTGRRVLGTLNNCAGGTTLWGTILTGEENFNQYFAGANGAPEAAKPRLARYGFPTTTYAPASGYRGWERYVERFNLTKHPNEANRFGYVVEIDPYDPNFVPRKRTALGRMKHEGADISLTADGRVVAYMGDDERYDYLYKFVSTNKFRPGHSQAARRHNLSLLDEGTLYVAKFSGDSEGEIDGSGRLPSDGAFDGAGVWLPLASDKKSYIDGMSVAEVFVFTREAADKAGATKMDRPEEVERHPDSGAIYVALTNNSSRKVTEVDEPNPRPTNRHGQILELIENNNDGAALRFSWNLPIICGDPADPTTYFAGFDKTKVSPISCPDNVGFDRAGNLWIATDGNALGSNDGFFAVPLEGPERGHVKQFLTVPIGAEACGLTFTPDMRAVFVAVQHPGEVDGATINSPVSRWPDGDFAKPSVAIVWRSAPGSKRIGA